jgi:hypothetical protein
MAPPRRDLDASPDACCTPPFDPSSFQTLLAREPARAAAILAAMRPPMRSAQAQAHANLCGVPVAQITQEWEACIATHAEHPWSPTPAIPRMCGAVYEPEQLADLLCTNPALAAIELAALSPRQQIMQAVAQAAWLTAHGLPTSFEAILATWEVRHAA